MSDFKFNMQHLLRSLEEIHKSTYQEKEVNLLGKTFILGIVTAEEHTKVHEYCSQYQSTITYALNAQIETLSYALKGIDQQYFGNIHVFPTGEYDQEGNPIKEQKHIFWRKAIGRWSPKLKDDLYKEYQTFETAFNEEVEKKFEFPEEPEQVMSEPQEEEKPRFKKINEKEAEQGLTSDSSFYIPEEGQEVPYFDEKGNLTAEGRALADFERKRKEGKLPKGVEALEIKEETEEKQAPQLTEEELQQKLREKLRPGEQLQKVTPKVNANLTNLTQLQQPEEKPAEITQQKPRLAQKPFQKAPQQATKDLPMADRLRREVEDARRREEQRAREDKDAPEVQLTSSSRPLASGAPIGHEKTVASKYLDQSRPSNR